MLGAHFGIIDETDELVLIKDMGPWDRHRTVTNEAEAVVEGLAPILRGRRLEYIDSEGERAELLVVNGKFAGFSVQRGG